MVSGEVKFHEKNSEAYKQEMWHVREPSVFLEHSVSGRVGEERVEAKRAKSLRTLKTMSSNQDQIQLRLLTKLKITKSIQTEAVQSQYGSLGSSGAWASPSCHSVILRISPHGIPDGHLNELQSPCLHFTMFSTPAGRKKKATSPALSQRQTLLKSFNSLPVNHIGQNFDTTGDWEMQSFIWDGGIPR